MKKILVCCLILIFVSVGVALAGDLIYKTEKTVNSKGEYVAIAEFDTGKNKTLRVGVSVDSLKGLAFVRIETMEGADAVYVDQIGLSDTNKSGSVVVIAPGKRLRLSANQPATYKTFVWSE